MEVKERRPNNSLSRTRRERGRGGERGEEDEGMMEGERRLPVTSVLTQKSYSSSETLTAFDQQASTQPLYTHRMPNAGPGDADDYRAPVGACRA